MKKSISTEQTGSNIAKVLELLASTPGRLEQFIIGPTEGKLRQPLGPGERSPIEIVAHLINAEARTSEAITLALLANEPFLVGIHPERDFGSLWHYDRYTGPDLLAYFIFRRTALVRVLESLTEAQWSRQIQEEGKKRKESIYWRARSQALHENEHLIELETRSLV